MILFQKNFIMVKRHRKAGKPHSLQIITLCISTAMVLILIGMVVLTVFTGRNLSQFVKEKLTITMILQPDMSDEESAALCERVDRLHYISSLSQWILKSKHSLKKKF